MMAATTPDDPRASLDAPARDALAALALGALARSHAWVVDALASPALRTPGSVAPTQQGVRHSLVQLQKAGLANEDERRAGVWTLPLSVYPVVYAELLARSSRAALREALLLRWRRVWRPSRPRPTRAAPSDSPRRCVE